MDKASIAFTLIKCGKTGSVSKISALELSIELDYWFSLSKTIYSRKREDKTVLMLEAYLEALLATAQTMLNKHSQLSELVIIIDLTKEIVTAINVIVKSREGNK